MSKRILFDLKYVYSCIAAFITHRRTVMLRGFNEEDNLIYQAFFNTTHHVYIYIVRSFFITWNIGERRRQKKTEEDRRRRRRKKKKDVPAVCGRCPFV